MPSTSHRKEHPKYVLLIEDNGLHAELVTEILDVHCGPVIVHAVNDFSDAEDFLKQNSYQCLVTSERVNGEALLPAIERLRRLSRDTPIVVVAGSGDEHEAAELIKRGVHDYLIKNRDTLERLPGILKHHILTSKKNRRQRSPRSSA